MITRMVTAAAFGLLLAGSAWAQAPVPATPAPTESAAPAAPRSAADPAAAPATPSSHDDCITAATSLGQLAENKTMPDDKIDKLEELFTKMEGLCDAKNFTEAANVAKDIKTMLDGQ